MIRFLFILFSALTFFGCEPKKKYDNPIVVIDTEYGDIIVELFTKQAPITTKAFLSHVDSDLYKNSTFYRVMREDNQVTGTPRSYLIQGGIWHTNYKIQQQLEFIPHESTEKTGIKHEAGVISMARTTPGTARSEFFICMDDQPGFDFGGINNPDGQGYAAFGKVVEGWPVLRKIYALPEENQRFEPQIKIHNIKRGN